MESSDLIHDMDNILQHHSMIDVLEYLKIYSNRKSNVERDIQVKYYYEMCADELEETINSIESYEP